MDSASKQRSIFSKEVVITFISSFIPVALTIYAGLAVVENELEHLHQIIDIKLNPLVQTVRGMEEAQILPLAETRITALEQRLGLHQVDIERRLKIVEDFKNRGNRCTYDSCQEMRTDINSLSEHVASCALTNSTLSYRVEKLEEGGK